LEDLLGSLTQSSESEKPEKRCIKNLLGIRGTFTATRSEVMQMVMSEHEAKIEGLARHVLKKKTLAERRRWLAEFEDKHGVCITEELKVRITELALEKKRNLGLTPTD
jgi:hypothetical protein